MFVKGLERLGSPCLVTVLEVGVFQDSIPSSIFGGMPPPKPYDAVASMRAVFA